LADVIGTHGVDAGTTSVPIVRRVNLPAFSGASNNFYIGSVDAVNSSLPIELVDFKAEPARDHVAITWKTASELNNDFFTLERSATGIAFTEITRINGSGTTTQSHSYGFDDMSPLDGTSYYRLMQTDFGGKSTYSRIVAVNVVTPLSPQVTVFPNPSARNEINFALSGARDQGELPVTVYDQMES